MAGYFKDRHLHRNAEVFGILNTVKPKYYIPIQIWVMPKC